MRNGWTSVALGSLLRQVERRVDVSSLTHVPYAGVRWYAAGVYARDVVSAESVKARYLNELCKGDITYNRMWATKAAFGVADSDVSGCLVTNDFPIFVPTAELLPDFIRLVFQTSKFQEEASNLATGTTERKRLKERDFLSISILLPSFWEQQRIVDLVSSIDAYIAGLERLATAARTARNAILHELLTSGGEDWTASTIGELCHVNPESTGTFTPERVVSYIDLSSVSSDRGISTELTRKPYAEMPGRAKRVVREGDVLVATVRPNLRGFALVPRSLDGEVASTGFAVLRGKPGVCVPEYIWNVVRSDSFVEHLMSRATGSSYPAVRPDDVASYSVSIPPLQEQQRIADLAASLDGVVSRTEDALAVSIIARKGILFGLLSGEHEIPESYDKFLGAA